MPGPEADLALLVSAAQQAGPIALSYWRAQLRAWDKPEDAGPVTEADLAVNDALHTLLTGARPDYGWLSEESEANASRLDARHCFIIDPIDGTRAFIAGQEGFAHSLAVADGERIVAAVVHLPAMNLTFTAFEDGPALLNDGPIRPSDQPLDRARILTYKSATDPEYWKNGQTPPFRREFRPSLAWRLCLVAEGRFDAALSVRNVWEWDIAAGSLIAERAGAVATDRHGQPMRFNSPRAMIDGMVVAGRRSHRQILAAMA